MNDKKSKVLKKETTISSGVGLVHEESNDVSRPNANDSDKKKVTTDTDYSSAIVASSAQGKHDATEETEATIDEDFSLRLESSDEDSFKDAIDNEVDASKGIKINVKPAILNKSDNLFSDIESSDDSIGYEPKSKPAVPPGADGQSREQGSPANDISGSQCEEEKVVESVFDPVESDEEFFEDLPLPQKTDQLSQETISDKTMQEEEERSSTPLIDEENDKSTELDLQSDGVQSNQAMANETNLETLYSPSKQFQSMDLFVESSVDIPVEIVHDSTDPSNTANVMTTTEILSRQDLPDNKSSDVNDSESSIGSALVSEVINEAIVVPPSSSLLGEQEEHTTSEPESLEKDTTVTLEILKQGEKVLFDSMKVSCSTSTTDGKTEKLVEALPIVCTSCKSVELCLCDKKCIPTLSQEAELPILGRPRLFAKSAAQRVREYRLRQPDQNLKINTNNVHFENSEKNQGLPQDPDNIPTSPTVLDVNPETKTDVEMTKEKNFESFESSKNIQNNPMSPTLFENENISPSVQPENMKTDVEFKEELNLECDDKMEDKLLNESLASENEKLEVEEPMEIDETILKVSGVSDLETIEEDTTVDKTDNQYLPQYEKLKTVQEEPESELTEGQEIHLESNEAPEENKDLPIVVENIVDPDEQQMNISIKKSTEVCATDGKLSEVKQSQPTPADTSETAFSQNLIEIEKSNKAEHSNEAAPLRESIKVLPIIDSKETKTDDKLSNSPKLSTDAEMKDVVSTEIGNPDNVTNKSDEIEVLLKNQDNVVKVADETEKPSGINSSSPDDHTAKKSPQTPEKCSDDQIKDGTETTAEIQNTDIYEATLKVIGKTSETTNEFNETKESPKEIEEPTKEMDACVEGTKENIRSPQELGETSQESNKQLSDSTEEYESSKEILVPAEELREQEESPEDTSLETSEQSSKQTKEQNSEKEESIIETLELLNESDVQVRDSFQKIEKTPEELNKQEKDLVSPQPIEEKNESETDSIEKQSSLEEISLKESVVSQKVDSIEKQESPKEPGESLEKDSIEKQASTEETALPQETVCSNKSEGIKLIEPSEVISSIKETLETTAEVSKEVVVEKVATAIDSTTSKEVTPAKVDPDIIEIDDDDDLEVEKKSEDSSKKDEKSSSSTTYSSTCEKELQDKKLDDVTKTSQNKEAKEFVTPMDIDEEITTEKPAQKPSVEDQIANQDPKPDQESAVKDGDVTMKGIPVQVLGDGEEPLLMIDTSHKEDNDTESNFMDNETATSAPTTTDSSSDGSLEVFYDKECVNYECKRASKNFYRAAVFVMNYFKISKKRSKTQFVCEDCYDRALSSYEELCKTLKMKQPILHGTTFKCQEFVEIIDSSDEDESDTGGDKVKVSDENELPKESIEMLEAELEGAIRKVMHSVDIQKQLSWTKQILQQRLTNLQEDSDFVSEQLRALQRKADHMHNSLYQCPKIKLRQLTPLDLNSGRMYNPESDNTTSIPLPGDIIRNPICVNEQYYAVKTKAIASWVPCKVIEEVEGYPPGYNATKTYKIKFTKLAKYPMFKTVYAKHMAYYDPPNVRLPIGSRVIAYFDATSLSRGKEKMLIPSAFYPGIIAEPLKQSNKFRYLVFYDDGYFQYVNHKDVRLVCQASENVWEDVHHQSREFIHNYLTQYAVNRPMVQTQKGQSMLVDYNGKWIYARVIDVDCSLVQMLFEGQSRSEWIYRGSTRLGPVYKESNNLSQKNTLNATRRRTEPFIRYINGDDSSSSQQVQETETPQTKAGSSEIRSVAKKSVSRVDTSNNNNNNSTISSAAQPVPTVRHLNNSTIFVDDDNKPKGKVVYYTARKNLPPRNYVPHICNPSCPFNITHNLSFYSPLAKPLLSGWERQVFRQKSKKFIVYRGPCGKRMRNIEELHRYLRVTDNELNVDNFDFSPDTNCLAEYVLEKCLVNKKDISCGKEKMPIPCVNYYDETMPPACEYSAVRIPTEGVPLNLDEEFMCGCDCEDDCSDKTKCACWQLTYAGAKYGMPTVPTEMVGYQYKRLYEHVPTGIYECNSRCKCKASCVNRVVQQPLQSKLQVFKTSNRGWGLRCINDVPRGSFICVYAGQMLTEQVANEGGLDAGDEYFAELDYIEVAEQIKEGYESDVQEPDEDEDLYNPEREDDDIDFRAPGESFKDKEFNTRLRARKGNKNSTDGEFDSQERQVISFEPNKNMDTTNEPNEKPTIRKLFGKDESCYVMDAKVRGNLGRYFNHSCSPNLFVQNVFVDTHDLRFPWVAFFASTHIRAGTELTWNYNYEVGVVPGKVLYCQCGAPNCRQRLL